MRLLVTPPFDSPIPPATLPDNELASIFAEHGIQVVDDPRQADLELAGFGAICDPSILRLPRERVVLVDGEPAQPQYLLPHYGWTGFAAIVTPLNGAYDPDCMAFYEPPTEPVRGPRARKIVQLATYRTQPGNANGGSHQVVSINGTELCSARVLCHLRASVGLAIHRSWPDFIDVYGRGWPEGVAVRNSRARADFVAERQRVAGGYTWDLNFENVAVLGYVSEKFWGALRAGCLPIYWGPSEFMAELPTDSVVDARRWLCHDGYDVAGLVNELQSMSNAELARRLATLRDWHESLPRDAAHRSWVRSAHRLARIVSCG